MKTTVMKALQRRLGMSTGTGEFVLAQLGMLVSCLIVFVCSSLLIAFVIARFTRGSMRAEALGSGLPIDPFFLGGLSLLFIGLLAASAWSEGVHSPSYEPRMSGCSSLATVYLGGSILKGLRSWIPRKPLLTAGQLNLATIVVAHLMEHPDTPLEGLRQSILTRSRQWTEADFDSMVDVLHERDLITGSTELKVHTQFKAEIRHLAG